ncbi:hypothetical protein [Methanothrix sp.]
MEIEIFDVEEKKFKCRDCGEEFRSTLEDPACPACKSRNVAAGSA